jgi:nucleoside-diphosphate-sugar epimerase
VRVFITGGAGFIGSEFARSALNGNLKEFNIEPSELIVYDSLTYAGNLQNLETLQNNDNFKFILGNICDPNLNKYIPYECDLVINFAAESHVDRSLSNASIFIETNVLGTQNVLEVVKEKKVKKFIQVSTDEVYGSITDGSWEEDFPLAPNSPYAASKASADLIALSYFKTYQLPLMITRCSNNYGPYQNIEKLIPFRLRNEDLLEQANQLAQVEIFQPEYSFDLMAFLHRMTVLCKVQGDFLYRIKGWIQVANDPRKYWVQSAGKECWIQAGEVWTDEKPNSCLVFIGIGLQRAPLERVLYSCRSRSE